MTDIATLLVKDAVDGAVKEEKRGIAITMLNDGVGISTIVKYTGLDEATIRQLQAELNGEA